MNKKFFVFFLLLALAILGWLGLGPVQEARTNQALPAATLKTFSFKKFPVLEYHHIRRPEGRWSRTPENFRKDLEWLYANGYYPVNLKDILTNFKGLPDGKVPVVLTFDDSPSNQFRYLPDGTLDPECAVGVIKAFHDEHPDDWPLRATFFVLVQTNAADRNLFGQPEHPEYKEQKLKQLVSWGMEVGGHCYSHERLSEISPEFACYTLARAAQELEKLSGQQIVSLAVPMGLYPTKEAVFSGQYQSITYDYKLVCEVAGGLQPVPGLAKFDPYHINRIQTIPSEWTKFFDR